MDDGLAICKEVASFHKNILGTGVIENGELTASYVKPNVPFPNEIKLKKILLQSHFITALAKSNEDYFGELDYVMIRWENSDIFLHVLDYSVPKLFAFRIVASYNHERLLKKISSYLKKID
jgi:hypothetical protein